MRKAEMGEWGGILRRVALLAVCCMVCAAQVLANPLDYKNVTIKYESMWISQSNSYFPVVLRVGNSGPERELRVVVRFRGDAQDVVITEETFTLSPRSETILEIPVLQGGSFDSYSYINIKCYLDGEEIDGSLSDNGRGYEDKPLFVFFSKGKTTLEDGVNKVTNWGNDISLNDFSVDVACRRWQSYVGLRGVVVVDGDTVGQMLPVQRQALVYWVRACGGIVWITDKNSSEVAQQLGFTSVDDASSSKLSGGIKRLPQGMGHIWLSKVGSLKTSSAKFLKSIYRADRSVLLSTFSAPQRKQRSRYHYGSRPSVQIPSFAYSLFDGLNSIPVIGYCVLSILLGLVIGPLNFLYLRKYKRISWFYFTAPVLAFIGVGGLAVYSVSNEGLGVKYNEYALLAVDQGSGEGTIYQARGVYSGLSVGELKYPQRTAATAYSKDNSNLNLKLSPGGDFALSGGWIMPRSASGLITMTMVTPRMELRVREEDGKFYIYNGFNHKILSVLYKDGKGKLYLAKGISAGEEQVAANVKAQGFVLNEQPELFMERRNSNWRLMAKMESLPYLENGGQEGRLLNGEYWYVVLGR